jgi:hypothetical protein
MLAITVPFIEKFACVVADKIIGLSRHPDYFEYHYRLRDLKKIRIEGLSKFIRVDGQGQVESIVLAETLLTKGAKIESQPVESLTDEDKAEIAAAIELVNQPIDITPSNEDVTDPAQIPDTLPDEAPAPIVSRPIKHSKKKSLPGLSQRTRTTS